LKSSGLSFFEGACLIPIQLEQLPKVVSETHGRRKGAARFQPPTSAREAQTKTAKPEKAGDVADLRARSANFPGLACWGDFRLRFDGRQQDAAAPLRALSFRKLLLATALSK
jgi:hypothetical protein